MKVSLSCRGNNEYNAESGKRSINVYAYLAYWNRSRDFYNLSGRTAYIMNIDKRSRMKTLPLLLSKVVECKLCRGAHPCCYTEGEWTLIRLVSRVKRGDAGSGVGEEKACRRATSLLRYLRGNY